MVNPSQHLILAVDLDGTLLFENDRIHLRDVELLKRGLPLTLVLATGRSLSGVRLPMQENGIVGEDQYLPYALVLNNGSLLFLPGETLLEHHPFPPELATWLAETACRSTGISIVLQGVRQDWLIDWSGQGMSAAKRYGFRPEILQPTDPLPEFNKMMCISDQPAQLQQLAAGFQAARVECNFSLADIYEITPFQVNKASGLKRMVAALRLAGAPLVAVGDGHNDVAMLALADLACVPKNGQAYLQQTAQLVFDRLENGVLQPVIEAALQSLPLTEALQRKLRDSIVTSG
ncbi:MAG: HAD family hydrolase [Bellilinea sp.]